MKGFRILILLLMVGILAAGCSHENDITAPNNQANSGLDKEGTETLGDPLIAIMAGSGFVEGGVGMTETDLGVLEITIPDGVAINQVLLYWAGATTGAPGDDMIKVDQRCHGHAYRRADSFLRDLLFFRLPGRHQRRALVNFFRRIKQLRYH